MKIRVLYSSYSKLEMYLNNIGIDKIIQIIPSSSHIGTDFVIIYKGE